MTDSPRGGEPPTDHPPPTTWIAPAKINLVLSVLGPRPDGYHELRTAYQAIDLGDRLTVSPRPRGDIILRCAAPGVPEDEGNLVVKAWRRLGAHRHVPGGCEVHLEKTIPAQGGLGGGSSDAAAMLVAANACFDLGLSIPELEGVGAEVGSDVPFFVRGGTQLGTGRGEILTPWPPLGTGVFLVTHLGIGASTAEVYGRGAFGLTPEPDPLTILRLGIAREEPEEVARGFFNALEGPAFSLQPALRELKGKLLGTGALGALLCGSGACVFAYFRDETAAMVAQETLDPTVAWTRLCRPLATGVHRSV